MNAPVGQQMCGKCHKSNNCSDKLMRTNKTPKQCSKNGLRVWLPVNFLFSHPNINDEIIKIRGNTGRGYIIHPGGSGGKSTQTVVNISGLHVTKCVNISGIIPNIVSGNLVKHKNPSIT